MSFYVNFDEDNIDLYYINSNISSPYNAVANTLANARVFSGKKSFEEIALELANGTLLPTYYNGEFIEKIKNHVLVNKFIPIQLEYKFTYQGSFSFNEFANVTYGFNRPKLNEVPYPIAVRYIDEHGCYYIERPPFQTEIDFNVNGRSKVNNSVKIWIPWTITAINPGFPQGAKVYFSSRQLSDFGTKYVPSFLPNTYGDGSICFGNSLMEHSDLFQDNAEDLRYIYSTVFNEYMSGGWNIDLYPNIVNYVSGISKNPVINKFLNITSEDLLKAYPKLKRSTAESIASHEIQYSHNRLEIFKYMFYAMGTMSLEETLNFYNEIIENNSSSINFSSITDKSVSATHMGYGTLANKISKQCAISYTSNSTFINFTLFLQNYEYLIKDAGVGKFLYEIPTSCDPSTMQRLLNENDISIIYSKVFEIFEAVKSQEIEKGYEHVFIFDIQNNTCTSEIVEIEKISSFYYDNLLRNYCFPLDSYQTEKVETFF